MSTLDEINKKIKKADNIVILTHENPDGDAVGSSLALYNALKNLKKNVEVVIPEFSRRFNNLPGISEVLSEGSKTKYDLAISVDVATIKLLNGWSNYFENANSTIVIDHHSTNSMFGDLNYVDYSSPACCQVLYTMFKHFKWEINSEMADDLLAGIITDTGGFQYSGVSKETFEIASHLLSIGAHLTRVYKDVMDTHSMANFKLRKVALDRMEFYEDGKISFTYITLDDEKEANAENGDYEGLVDEGRRIEGVEVAIFIHEIKEGNKVSLRANNYVNVSDVALMFGGGGHPLAAGATVIDLSIDEIKEKLINEIKLHLK